MIVNERMVFAFVSVVSLNKTFLKCEAHQSTTSKHTVLALVSIIFLSDCDKFVAKVWCLFDVN